MPTQESKRTPYRLAPLKSALSLLSLSQNPNLVHDSNMLECIDGLHEL